MWYLIWFLGTGLACAFAVRNAIRFERDVESHSRKD